MNTTSIKKYNPKTITDLTSYYWMLYRHFQLLEDCITYQH